MKYYYEDVGSMEVGGGVRAIRGRPCAQLPFESEMTVGVTATTCSRFAEFVVHRLGQQAVQCLKFEH